VECAGSEHCDQGFRCDTAIGRCAQKCVGSEDCRSFGSLVCDLPQGICVGCLEHIDCANDANPDSRRCVLRHCVECEKSEDCAGTARPVCVGFHCTECVFDNDCGPGSHCELGRGRCEPN